MSYVDVRIHFKTTVFDEPGEERFESLDDMEFEEIGCSEDMLDVDMYAFTEMFMQSEEQYYVVTKLIEAIR